MMNTTTRAEALRYTCAHQAQRITVLEAENERLRLEIQYAGTCEHGAPYADHACLLCWGDGTEVLAPCAVCGSTTWHRDGHCLRHDSAAPTPYSRAQRYEAAVVRYVRADAAYRAEEPTNSRRWRNVCLERDEAYDALMALGQEATC